MKNTNKAINSQYYIWTATSSTNKKDLRVGLFCEGVKLIFHCFTRRGVSDDAYVAPKMGGKTGGWHPEAAPITLAILGQQILTVCAQNGGEFFPNFHFFVLV